MIKGIVFDFWGTLMENGVNPSPLKQVRSMMNLDKLSFSAFVASFERSFMTKRFESLAEAFESTCRNFNIRYNQRFIDDLIGLWNKNRLLAKPFTDTISTLEALRSKGLKLALLSNTDAFSIEPLLEKYDMLKYFDSIVMSYKTGFLKTDKRSFEVILEELGLEKDEVIMVGDSLQSDMLGAQNAGIKAVLVDRRNIMEFENKVSSLEELKRFLE